MSDERRTALEGQVHALLCDVLDEEGRDALLEFIADDEEARRVLKEILSCRRLSRAAYGYDGASQHISASMTELRAALEDIRRHGITSVGERRERRHFGWQSLHNILWPAAAVIAISVAVYLGVSTQRTERIVYIYTNHREIPAGIERVTVQEMDSYRKIWQELEVPSKNRTPWVLLGKDEGRFEYLSADGAGVEERPFVLRCVITTSDGTVLRSIDLLLPKGHPVKLDLGEVGKVGGQPLRCEVVADRGWITMAVAVGETEAKTVGVRGTAPLDGGITNIGWFTLGDRDLRVLVQAITLDGKAG